jgi:hypothetical protein
MGAKIGLGVGIPVALALGLVAGWLLFRRRKKRDGVAQELPAVETEQYKHYQNGNYYNASMSEAPLKSPVEMGQTPYARGYNGWGGEPQEKLENSPMPPARYEM